MMQDERASSDIIVDIIDDVVSQKSVVNLP